MVEIHGRGTNFRFFYAWDMDEYDKPRCKYTFLLHKHTVLVGEHYEHEFTITDQGDLLIYKYDNERWYMKPKEVKGIIFPDSHPMVKMLKEALADDGIEEILRS